MKTETQTCPYCNSENVTRYRGNDDEFLCKECAVREISGMLYDAEPEEIATLRRKCEDVIRKDKKIRSELIINMLLRGNINLNLDIPDIPQKKKKVARPECFNLAPNVVVLNMPNKHVYASKIFVDGLEAIFINDEIISIDGKINKNGELTSSKYQIWFRCMSLKMAVSTGIINDCPKIKDFKIRVNQNGETIKCELEKSV